MKHTKHTYTMVVKVSYRGKVGGSRAIRRAVASALESSDGRRNIEEYLEWDARICRDGAEAIEADVTVKVLGER
jgi:ribosomal protein S9